MRRLLGGVGPHQPQETKRAHKRQRHDDVDDHTGDAHQRRQQRVVAGVKGEVERIVERGKQHANHIDVERRHHLLRVRRRKGAALEQEARNRLA